MEIVKAKSQFVHKLVNMINSRPKKSSMSYWQETFDPLFNIDARKAQQIYDYARRGNFAQLQYLYNEIENCDPTFMTCVTRRCAAISELDWKVVQSDERLNRNADKVLVKEQIEFLESALARIDNMPEALEHMALSAFRGFSVLNIWRDTSDQPTHLECLDHWNICYDKINHIWKWNSTAVSYIDPSKDSANNGQLSILPPDDIIAIKRKREIDWPAMKIFLRNAIGERDWGRFLETYGLPPVIITMPEFSSKEDEDAYVSAAENIFVGRSGVVPYGSNVNFASEARGTDPFSEFIDHQMKLYVLLATGGTLTSLSESGSGTLAGNAQMEVWKGIVRGDIRTISNAINKQLCEGLIKGCKDFRGKPVLAQFELDSTPKMTADEIMDLAGKVSSAGFEMDPDELSKATGFTIRKPAQTDGGGMFNSSINDQSASFGAEDGSNTAEEPTEEKDDAHDAPEVALNAVEDVAGNEEYKQSPVKATAPSPVLARNTEAEDLAYSLQDDFKAVAERINEILTLPEAERSAAAVKLIQELDSMIPDDPMMAQVISEQMQSAFASQIEKQPKGDAPAANKVVPNSVTVNMSAEKAISYIEWMLGSQNRKDRDEALAELENYKDMIIARVGRKQYDNMVMRASNCKEGNE